MAAQEKIHQETLSSHDTKPSTLDVYDGLEEVYDAKFREAIQQAVANGDAKYVHSGASSDVMAVTVDGKRYAVRAIGGENPELELRKHLAVAERASKYARFEHVEAASLDTMQTVAELLPGEVFTRPMSLEAANTISYDRLQMLYADMLAANAEGIGFDGHRDNFLYDPESGFFVVDLGELEDDRVDRVHGTAAEALGYQVEEAMIAWSKKADIATLNRLDTVAGYILDIIGDDPADAHVVGSLSRLRKEFQDYIVSQLAVSADSWDAYV